MTNVIEDVGSEWHGSLWTRFDDCVLAMDPTGQYILTWKTTTGKGKSSDGGYSLSDIANLPVTGTNWFFGYAGGSGSASRWVAVGSYVYYSDDFFNSAPMDKRGNILDLAPILDLDIVKILEF